MNEETAMEQKINRQWRTARWPEGLAKETDFEWTESPVPRPGPGEALVQNKLLSLDITNRVWMWERETYLPQQNLGEVFNLIDRFEGLR
jgi:NADPH-dependent curcumin reductase CurA